MNNMIARVDNVDFIYQQIHAETQAIKVLSFSVHEREFVSIVGPSGCGKTTVLSLLMGLIQPTDGSVTLFDGEADAIGRVGYMLQRDHLLDWRTVEENVLLGLEVKRMLTEERKAHAMALLERYGLGAFRKHHPRALSGGMRQKVALIRTLACDPTLMLLDEPFSSLDYQTRLRFADEDEPRHLGPGDWVDIPAHCRHRVEWTDPDQPTVWLAVHSRD